MDGRLPVALPTWSGVGICDKFTDRPHNQFDYDCLFDAGGSGVFCDDQGRVHTLKDHTRHHAPPFAPRTCAMPLQISSRRYPSRFEQTRLANQHKLLFHKRSNVLIVDKPRKGLQLVPLEEKAWRPAHELIPSQLVAHFELAADVDVPGKLDSILMASSPHEDILIANYGHEARLLKLRTSGEQTQVSFLTAMKPDPDNNSPRFAIISSKRIAAFEDELLLAISRPDLRDISYKLANYDMSQSRITWLTDGRFDRADTQPPDVVAFYAADDHPRLAVYADPSYVALIDMRVHQAACARQLFTTNYPEKQIKTLCDW